MKDTVEADTARTPMPVHYWLFCFMAVLWNGFGAFDFVMTFAQGDRYMRAMGMTDAQIAYFHQMPAWAIAVWALGVGGAALGTVFMLLRSRFARTAFGVSLAGMLLSLIYTHLMSDGGKMMGQEGLIMSMVITAGCLVFIWYSSAAIRRGILR